MGRRIYVPLDLSSDTVQEVNYSTLLAPPSPARAENAPVERTDSPSASSREGSCYDSHDSFIDDDGLVEQFQDRRPSDASQFRVGAVDQDPLRDPEATMPAAPEPRARKKPKRKQAILTNTEDEGLQAALQTLKDQVAAGGTKKRLGADLDQILLSFATAARAAHPTGLFEQDAKDMLFEQLAFSSVKAIANKVAKLEVEHNTQVFNQAIEMALPLLQTAIGECAEAQRLQQDQKRAEDQDKKKAEGAEQLVQPTIQKAIPGSNAEAPAAAESAAAPALEPAAAAAAAPPVKKSTRPRFSWSAAAEQAWYQLAKAELSLLEISMLSNNRRNSMGAKGKPIDPDKNRQAAEREVYKKYCGLFVPYAHVAVVQWEELRQVYNRVHKKHSKPDKAVASTKTAKKQDKATAGPVTKKIDKPSTGEAVDAAKRKRITPTVGSTKQLTPAKKPKAVDTAPVNVAADKLIPPVMGLQFEACPPEFLQRWKQQREDALEPTMSEE